MNNTWSPYAYANISGVYDAMVYGNSVTFGALGFGIVLGTWVVMFMLMRRVSTDEQSFAASSFVGAILAALLRGTDQLSDPLTMLMLVMTLAGAFLLWKDK